MKVNSINGNKIGFIKDILIDFNFGIVKGFSISSYKVFQKSTYVLTKDILSFCNSMIVTEYRRGKLLELKELCGMNIIDLNGNIIGMVEDIIFSKDSFLISGIVVTTGYITNFLHGKKVFLIKDLILGEENLLYYEDKNKVMLSNVPNKILMEDDTDERKN